MTTKGVRVNPKRGKRWFQSRTVWANAFTFAALTLGVLGASPLLADWAAHIGLANALIGVWLRFVTSEPIAAE